MNFEPNIFANKIQRVSTPKMQEMFRQYKNDLKSLSYADYQALLSFAERRIYVMSNIPQTDIMLNMMLFSDLGNPRNPIKHNKELLENAKKELRELQIVPLLETLDYIDTKQVEIILKRFHNILSPQIVETLIINLPENKQIEFIDKCKSDLMKSEPTSFNQFLASVSKNAQKYILENFKERFSNYSIEQLSDLPLFLYQDNIEFYTKNYQDDIKNTSNVYEILISCNDENFEKTLIQFKEQLSEINADKLMQLLLFKTQNSAMLFNLWAEMPSKLKEVSIPNFKIFIKRLEKEDSYKAIYTFKEKFAEMDLNEIVEIFENDSDDIKAKILVTYRDRFSGEESDILKKIMSKSVKNKMLDTYSSEVLEDFEKQRKNGIDLTKTFKDIVSNLSTKPSNKLFDDEYLKAIFLCRILLKDKDIDDKNSSYIELRTKYMEHLFQKLDRDNTADNINNSLFYRIVKGNIDFKNIYTDLKSVKALIYLSRNPQVKDIEKIEDIIGDLSEKQVQSYNIKLYKKLCEDIKEQYKDSKPSDENIQKLAYKLFFFGGYDKAKKILETNKDFTTLEYLFNDLRIKNIELNEDGTPKINEKLSNFLFGSNKDGKNANFYRIINNEIPNADKYLSTIFNDWDAIYKKLNGNITLKRILDLLKSDNLILKPNEYKLLEPLQEIGTRNPEIVQKAKKWYEIMKERQISSIPKISGNIENYEYEMLDLDDPLALAVGYLTRCCFLINGLSKESLYHSISSKNGRTFIVRKDGELIAQSWVWRNGNVLCFDNVETRGNYSYDKLLEIYIKASNNLIQISAQSEDENESLKLITYGTSESKMTRAEKVLDMKPLPRVLENVNYSDAKNEQCILAKTEYEDLYYGDVSARYIDPRLPILEYDKKQIEKLDADQLNELDKQLDSIKYDSNGTLRNYYVKDYQYIACNKDWYIVIDKKGQVNIQLLKKDNRAIEECKNKAKSILENIKTNKITIPIDFEGVGGENR